jgi:hypothetical protein
LATTSLRPFTAENPRPQPRISYPTREALRL